MGRLTGRWQCHGSIEEVHLGKSGQLGQMLPKGRVDEDRQVSAGLGNMFVKRKQ